MSTDFWQDLMDRAYDKWRDHRDWDYRRFLLELSPVERKAVILGNFNYQTTNGGLQQWVDNGYASSTGKDLLSILEEMGTELSRQVAGIVRDLSDHVDMNAENKGFGENYWVEEYVDDTLPCYEEVEALTNAYYEFYEEFVVEVDRYLEGLTTGADLPQ